MIILAGDIGGTKTWLQLAEFSPARLSKEKTPIRDDFTVLFERRFASGQYASFDHVIGEFLQVCQQEGLPSPEQGCIGVAGPVVSTSDANDTAKVTNLPWQLDAHQLAIKNHLNRLRLINDFQAVAFGLEMLTHDEVVVLQEGSVPAGVMPSDKAVIGAGTGLGQALLVWCGEPDTGSYKVVPSEGGHCDFAASGGEQRELVSFLATQRTRVSVEDVLSGRGLVNIYNYLADKHSAKASETLASAMNNGDAAAAVGEAALSGTDPLARQAVDLFVAVYGTQAGNYALTCMARGGIYIAGGIAAKLHERFTAEKFLANFHDKGPMRGLMKSIPVRLVLDAQVGLKGAVFVASRL